MDILRELQPDTMLVLSAVCGTLALLVYMAKTIGQKRKLALMLVEISAMLLLVSDRFAYLYRGDGSELGWWMVRISNFLVFFLTLVVLWGFNLYLEDLYTHEGGLPDTPRCLKIAGILVAASLLMVVVSQFTGLYYSFDEMNRYHRAPGYIVSCLFPMTIMVLQVSVVLRYRKLLNRNIWFLLLLFASMSLLASVLQTFLYGISLNNMTIAVMAVLLYVFALKDLEKEVDHGRKLEIEYYKDEREKEHALFEQTAEALAMAIDAKDKYTHGHSTRVAMYSTQIAREAGKSAEECEKVYFAGLLHDVGKIGIPDAIISKDGRLTEDEFAQIKNHPVYGNQILSSISRMPYLSIGAHFHHERYDGQGYPRGLKGEDIPDIARIIAVADAYDAMTSKRSYRDPIPQQKVREELVKGMGSQFDPQYAGVMLHMLDQDLDYGMRERKVDTDDAFINHIKCDQIYYNCSLGIPVNDKKVQIRLTSRPDDGFPEAECLPTILLFDALDARVHVEEAKRKDLLYLEYARLRFDGHSVCEGARKLETRIKHKAQSPEKTPDTPYREYSIEGVRVKDHMLIRISDGRKTAETIVALPDSTRFSYISLTGEHCMISSIHVDRVDFSASEEEIPRIAEEVSFIRGLPQGDIPNVQIDSWRSNASKGIRLDEGMRLRFHSKSLPTARLVWHCPFVSLYTSQDGRISGEGYREFLLLRLDGESWDSDAHAVNETRIEHTDSFPGWGVWKEMNRQGLDFEVLIRRDGRCIEMRTENLGISIFNKTHVLDDVDDLYIALTGDQCALSDIRITQGADLPQDSGD